VPRGARKFVSTRSAPQLEKLHISADQGSDVAVRPKWMKACDERDIIAENVEGKGHKLA
jgi:hypothetical protein